MKETYQPRHAAPKESKPADEEYTGRHEAPTTSTGDRIRDFGLNAAQASERVASFVDSKLLAGRERLERGKAILGNIGRGVLGLTVIAVEGAGKVGTRGVETVKNDIKSNVGFSRDVVYEALNSAKENVTDATKKTGNLLDRAGQWVADGSEKVGNKINKGAEYVSDVAGASKEAMANFRKRLEKRAKDAQTRKWGRHAKWMTMKRNVVEGARSARKSVESFAGDTHEKSKAAARRARILGRVAMARGQARYHELRASTAAAKEAFVTTRDTHREQNRF